MTMDACKDGRNPKEASWQALLDVLLHAACNQAWHQKRGGELERTPGRSDDAGPTTVGKPDGRKLSVIRQAPLAMACASPAIQAPALGITGRVCRLR